MHDGVPDDGELRAVGAQRIRFGPEDRRDVDDAVAAPLRTGADDGEERYAEHECCVARRLVHANVVRMPVTPVLVVAHDRGRLHGRDDGGDVRDDFPEVGGAQGLRVGIRERLGTSVAPAHPRVEVAPRFAARDPRVGVAEEAVIGHPENPHGRGELGRAHLGEGGAVTLEVLELRGHDFAALAARAGEHRDRGGAVEEGRDGAACGDRLVVGVGVHEEDVLLGRRLARCEPASVLCSAGIRHMFRIGAGGGLPRTCPVGRAGLRLTG